MIEGNIFPVTTCDKRHNFHSYEQTTNEPIFSRSPRAFAALHVTGSLLPSDVAYLIVDLSAFCLTASSINVVAAV